MTGGGIHGNSAGNSGSGIHVDNNGKFDQTGGIISDNSAVRGSNFRNLINLLEEADKDIENGNYLTEEEMDNKLDLLFKNA